MDHKQQRQTEHNHSGHGFSDKKAVAKMAPTLESAERDLMQRPEEVLQYMGEIKGKTIMDIGAGTGYFTVKFIAKGAHVIAADASDAFLDHIEERIRKEQLNNIELRKVPYDNPLLKDAEADIVFISNTYHHIDDRPSYLTKVRKGLKTGGELIVIDFFKTEFEESIQAPSMQMRASVDEVVFELRKAGFTTIEAELNLLPFQYILKAK